MNWVPYGPNALLFRFGEQVSEKALSRQRALVTDLERHPPAGLVEVVPAFTTILLVFDPRIVPQPNHGAPELLKRLEAVSQGKIPAPPVKEIPVRYDGDDLETVVKRQSMTMEKICELHCAPVYKVYMIGFSPGFPYLGDLDPRLHTPRLASPRAKVPAGSVAIGGEHTGIYTVDSPGGWNVIGHTPLKIFDPVRGEPNGPEEAMFWLKPGDRVKFVRVD